MARFLILDDDEDIGQVVQMILELDGHEAAVSTDGETAVTMHKARPTDVLITDIFMPERDGFEVIRQFSQQFPDVSIIAMSGGGDTLRSLNYLSLAREVGAVHVIRKPFEKEGLLAVVREVLAARDAAHR
jgi:DNA-binding response OmpR family regulator